LDEDSPSIYTSTPIYNRKENLAQDVYNFLLKIHSYLKYLSMKKKCLDPIIIIPNMRVQYFVKAMLLSAPRFAPWPHSPTIFDSTEKKW
jgi:cytochrome c oxidase assembly factor CtaG